MPQDDLRPGYHFGLDSGWLNDPYGVVWHRGQYHLFFQTVPGTTTWAPQCRWGHAVADDLLRWRRVDDALVPSGDEVGCWSGAAVPVGDDLLLFSTRVAGTDLGLGQVVRAASPGAVTGRWQVEDDVPAVTAPEQVRLRDFRDPCVLRDRDRWVMVVAGGDESGDGVAVQFVSDDLRNWRYTGVLARRSGTDDDPGTGATWECPQLFPVGDDWVLMASICDGSGPQYVVAAVGEYDGTTYVARRWQRLTAGAAYAMTAFTDRTGRRSVMAWLRERADFDPATAVHAGAHTVPYLVQVNDGLVHLHVHPDLRTVEHASRVLPLEPGEWVDLPATCRVEITVDDVQHDIEIALADGTVVHLDRAAALVRMRDADGSDATLPLAPGLRTVTVLADGDIVEMSAGAALVTHRIPRHVPQRLRVTSGAGARAEVGELSRIHP